MKPTNGDGQRRGSMGLPLRFLQVMGEYNWADTPIFLEGVPLLSMKIRNIIQSIPHSQLQILIRPGNQVVLHALDKGFG